MLAECALASWQSVFCKVSRTKSSSTLVNSGALNQVGTVERTLSGLDGMHHDAQLELYAAYWLARQTCNHFICYSFCVCF